MHKIASLCSASLGIMSAVERQHGRYMRAPDGHPGPLSAQATLQALRERRTGIVAQMQAIIDAAEAEDRELTAEETTSFDALRVQSEGLATRIERMAGVQEAASALAASTGALSRRQRPQRGPEAVTTFDSFGEFMAAVRFRPNDQRLNFVEGVGAADDDGEFSAEMRMDNNPSGGFMVPNEFRATIMQVDPADALVRPRATVIEPGNSPDTGVTMPALDQTGTAPGNMFGGMTFNWIAEGDAKPETGAGLREVSLTPHEIAGFVTVTDKLLRNWQGSSAFIETLMRNGVAAAEDYAFIRANGKNKPLGALNSGATKYVNRTTANKVTYIDLVTMVASFLMRGGKEPVWSLSQQLLPQLTTMQDPQGRYIWQASAVPGLAGTLLGYPVKWHNRMPQLGTKGDVLLADWSYYLIKDGSGPFVAASEHVLFTANKTLIKIFYNVDGAPWLTAPIQEENGITVSPFVGLDVPSA